MIGLVIMGILLAKGAPAFSGWIQSTQIRTSAESILNGLQLARAEAVRTNSTVRFSLTDSLAATCVLSAAGGSWVISRDDPSGLCNVSNNQITPFIVQSRSGEEGSRNAVVAAGQSVIAFNGLGRQVSVTNADASVTPNPPVSITVNVTNPTGGACATTDNPSNPMHCLGITVSNGGEVRLCDTRYARSVANPTGC
jgi:type IV fimbrial biogenesis protein FimT